jgi:hypothetical protein
MGVVVARGGVKVKGEAPLEEGIEEHAEGPGIRHAAVIRHAQNDLWRGIVVGPTTGFELLVGGDAAGEPQVGERDYRVRVRGPIDRLIGELRQRKVDEDVCEGGQY